MTRTFTPLNVVYRVIGSAQVWLYFEEQSLERRPHSVSLDVGIVVCIVYKYIVSVKTEEYGKVIIEITH